MTALLRCCIAYDVVVVVVVAVVVGFKSKEIMKTHRKFVFIDAPIPFCSFSMRNLITLLILPRSMLFCQTAKINFIRTISPDECVLHLPATSKLLHEKGNLMLIILDGHFYTS